MTSPDPTPQEIHAIALKLGLLPTATEVEHVSREALLMRRLRAERHGLPTTGYPPRVDGHSDGPNCVWKTIPVDWNKKKGK